MTDRVGAVVLAAGFGTRLAPLTDSIPKPLLEVGGTPVVSRITTLLRAVPGMISIAVVVNDAHLPQWHAWQADQPSMPELHLVPNGVTDVADAPGAVADMHRGLAAGSRGAATEAPTVWLVIAGDNLVDEPLGHHVDLARSSDAAVVLCRNLGGAVPPGRFGEITVDDSGTVVGFREKPDDPTSPLVSTCTYVLPADAPALVRTFLEGTEAHGGHDSPGQFVAWLAARRRVVASELTGPYFDIGNLETLAAAQNAYDGRDPQRPGPEETAEEG